MKKRAAINVSTEEITATIVDEEALTANAGLVHRELTDTDRAMLQGLAVAVDAIAHSFGRSCEVVLHSFADLSHSIIKIRNGHVSGRVEGAPITDRVLEVMHRAGRLDSDVFSYHTPLPDGRLVKSTTALIRNGAGGLIGVLCINVDVSGPLSDLLGQLIPAASNNHDHVVEHFPENVSQLVRDMVLAATTEVAHAQGLSGSKRTELVVQDLYARGAFEVKGAVDLVAKELGVSRYTVYNYLRGARVVAGDGRG